MREIKVRGLSNRLSTLVGQALDDMKAVSKLDGYTLNMGHWHTPLSYTNSCHVCMAGSLLVVHGKARADSMIVPYNCDLETANKLRAINELREGAVQFALDCLQDNRKTRILSTPARTKAIAQASRFITAQVNDDTGLAPVAVYRKVARILKAVGL